MTKMDTNESLRFAVRKLVNEWDQFLHFPDGVRWKLEGVHDLRGFFTNLPLALDHGMTLMFEAPSIPQPASDLFRNHPAAVTKKLMRDIICPTPESFDVGFSAEFSEQVCELVESLGQEPAFSHLQGYSQTEVLFTFHDAFHGDLYVSNTVPEETVHRFAASVRSFAEQVHPVTDFRQQFIDLARALNPPWWKRLQVAFRKQTGPD